MSCISICILLLYVVKLNFGYCLCVEYFYGSYKVRLYVLFFCFLYGYINILFFVWKYKFVFYLGIEYVFMINCFDIIFSINYFFCYGIF